MAQALRRELREETGYECRITGELGVHEFLVRTDHAGALYTHHIAVFRTVEFQGRLYEVGSVVAHPGWCRAERLSGLFLAPPRPRSRLPGVFASGATLLRYSRRQDVLPRPGTDRPNPLRQ